MYRKHFGLTLHPFAKDISSEELFASQAGRELEVRLTHLLELRGIGLVTGEVGSGKTTLCRKVTSGLHSGLYRVIYVPLTTGNVMDLYKSISWELGLPTERSLAALYRCIRAEVTRLSLEARLRLVLVVDEASVPPVQPLTADPPPTTTVVGGSGGVLDLTSDGEPRGSPQHLPRGDVRFAQ